MRTNWITHKNYRKDQLCVFKTEPQMQLRETIRKSKVVLHKTMKNIKCFIFGRYQKLPRSLSFNPFLSCSGNARTYTTSDQFYNEFYDILQSDLNRMNRSGEINSMNMSREQVIGTERHVSFEKQSPEKSKHHEDHVVKEKKKKGNKSEDLALKMKELEMMDSSDVEHVLDIEEALHYYSRLTSPVYLDIVDKFFTDMHSEYTLPHSSLTNKHSKSKGRVCSIRL